MIIAEVADQRTVVTAPTVVHVQVVEDHHVIVLDELAEPVRVDTMPVTAFVEVARQQVATVDRTRVVVIDPRIPGRDGRDGQDGGGGDKNAVYEQPLPVLSETVTHGLSKRCSVDVTSLAGKRVRSTVTYVSDDAVVIEFNSPTSYRAYFN